MPKAIVTGASGFIGRKLCQLLVDKNWEVTACGRTNKPGPWNNFIEWDISSEAPPTTSTETCDAFFHLASKAHALTEIGGNLDEYTRTNVTGTQHALHLARTIGAKRFIYFSSVKAMGEGNAEYDSANPIDETFDCKPAGPYGTSKLKAESLVLNTENNINGVIIRPCLVYGANSKGNLTKMAEAIRKKRFPPIPQFGNKRSVVHVDDLCHLALACATSPSACGNVFIAAEPHAYSTRRMYEFMLTALQKKTTRFQIPYWALKILGCIGDTIGKAKGSRFIFDSDALRKLSESAHYNGNKATRVLGFKYENSLPRSLINILSNR